MAYSVQHRITNRGLELQASIRQMLREQDRFTHWVTLSFNHKHLPDAAQRILQLWFMNVNARMFRAKRFRMKDTCDLHFFFAFPEDTLKENPHFHLLARVAPERAEYFERIVEPMWKSCVPSGDADVQRIGETNQDHEWVQEYATKNANRAFSHDGFLTSNMLKDGRLSAPVRRNEHAHA